MKRLLYIYNPNAGRQRSKAVLADVLDVFAAQGYTMTVHPTTGPGSAAEATVQLAPHHDRLVCCGGDGTLNEVVSGLLSLPEDQRPPLGYLPMGSTNDFSRNLDLPKSIPELAQLAGEGESRLIDIGDSSGHLFTYVSAFGLFTEVSYSTPQSMKNILGHFAYVVEGAGQLINIPSYTMTVSADGQLMAEGDFIYGMVGNTVSVGGVMNLPRDQVKLDDGRLEVLLVRKPHSLKDWQEALTMLATLKMPCDGTVVSFSAEEVTFSCDKEVAWTVDGEFGGSRQETVIRTLPRALRIVCGN